MLNWSVNEIPEYELIRSNRKTIAIQIRNAKVIVRAPKYTPRFTIDRFVRKNEAYIKRKLEEQKSIPQQPLLTDNEIKQLKKQARAYIPERVAYYADIMGISYGTIAIRMQKSRWGSCSSKKNLNFNCLLMLAPVEVTDSVIVHELCHLKHMNHSKAFYQEVYTYYPEYEKYHQWLKKNGNAILSRVFA